jgi:hypothetical protein
MAFRRRSWRGDEFSERINALNKDVDVNVTVAEKIIIEEGGMELHRRVIEIGSWDMDAVSSKSFNLEDYNIDPNKIVSVEAFIYSDTAGIYHNIHDPDTDNAWAFAGYVTWSLLNVSVVRRTGGWFDDVRYNDTTINRGYIIIVYKE